MVLDRLLARENDVTKVLRANPRAASRAAPENAVALVKPDGVLASVFRAARLARARARVVNLVSRVNIPVNPPGPGRGFKRGRSGCQGQFGLGFRQVRHQSGAGLALMRHHFWAPYLLMRHQSGVGVWPMRHQSGVGFWPMCHQSGVG